MRLSKTDFMAGLRCPLALWLRRHHREAASPPTPDRAVVLHYGDRVDAFARERFPGGVNVTARGLDRAAAATAAVLSEGAARVYQATFVTEWGGCMVDVLDREADGTWTLREVKMTPGVRPGHVWDAAFQAAVLGAAGLEVGRVLVTHVNRQSETPELRRYFVDADVTPAARARSSIVRQRAEALRLVAAGRAAPRVPVGQHCVAPYPCPFRDWCWRDVPPDGVAHLPVNRRTLTRLRRSGYRRIGDVPEKTRLPAAAARRVAAAHSGVRVAGDRVRAWMATLVPPVRFLALASLRTPLPAVEGVRPYEPVPFAFAVASADGSGGPVRPAAWADGGATDARADLARALLDALGEHGHIVVEDPAAVEDALRVLRRAAPTLAVPLRRVRIRLLDLPGLVGAAVAHPRLDRAASLPALVRALRPEHAFSRSAPGAAEALYVTLRALPPDADRAPLVDAIRGDVSAAADALASLHAWLRGAERAADH